jgi:hypothetical protein
MRYQLLQHQGCSSFTYVLAVINYLLVVLQSTQCSLLLLVYRQLIAAAATGAAADFNACCLSFAQWARGCLQGAAGKCPPGPSKDVRAAGLASGAYTIWRDIGDGIGVAQVNITSAATVQDCLLACDRDEACAAVYMVAANATLVSADLSQCTSLQGHRQVSSTLRSVTRVVTTRLATADVTETLSLA